MPKVYKLGISANNNQTISEVNSIKVLANQGIVGDRHFNEFNDPYNQITLIESENIDYYNIKYGLNIPYKDFRRNISQRDRQQAERQVNESNRCGHYRLGFQNICAK